MMYNELLIVIILIILLIVVVFQIIKTNNKENFGGGGLRSRVHSRDTCNNFPFENDECSSDEYLRAAGDIHLDYSSEAFPNYMSNYNIHMVYPKDPCCLRTCINDFTYTEENTQENSPDRNRLGQYRQFIDKNLYFASKCDQCLENFYVALKRLNSDHHCDESAEELQGQRASCEL